MQRILITGANRGIGYELVHQWVKRDHTMIFAACRKPDEAEMLQKLRSRYPEKLFLVALDVSDDASIFESVAEVQKYALALDVIVNNAAINPSGQDLGELTTALLMHVLHINTVAPLMVVQAYLPLLRKGSNVRVVNISSDMASLTYHNYGGDYGYCASKAALNMTTRGLAADLKREGIITVSLDPGWVQTDMGGSGATLKPEQSASGVIGVIENLTMAHNGKFLAWDGSEHLW